jgi:hypothetical protein
MNRADELMKSMELLKEVLNINDEFVRLFGECMILCNTYYFMMAGDVTDKGKQLEFFDNKANNRDRAEFKNRIKSIYGAKMADWINQSLTTARNMLAHSIPKPYGKNSFLYVNNGKQYIIDIPFMKDFLSKGTNMLKFLDIAKNLEKTRKILIKKGLIADEN